MPTKRKLRSTAVEIKDKPVESQTDASKKDKRKGASGNSVGSGANCMPTIAQPPSSSSSKRKKKARAKSPDPATAGNLPPTTTGTSSIPTANPSSNSVSGVPESIINILSIFENMIAASQSISPLSTTNASDSTAPKAPVPSKIPGSSGSDLPPIPLHWEARYTETFITSSSCYQTFPIDKSSSEFESIAGVLSPFKVTSAEQIINPELWLLFCEKRKEMLKSKTDDLKLLKGLGCSTPVVARKAKFSEEFSKHRRLKTNYGEYSPNETLLLHCTNQANLEKIMVQGLDERLGCSGRLGRGVYFSDDPEKCIQYDKTYGTILVFGVLLGDCISVDDFPNVSSFVREPEKEAEQKRHKNDHFFDSITGRPAAGGGFNEYVIFNRNQCYPFYIVKYQKAYREYLEGTKNIYASARKDVPIIAWSKLAAERVPMPSYPGWKTWPFYASSIFKLKGKGDSSAKTDNGALATSAPGKSKLTDTTIDLTKADGDLQPSKRRKVEDEECSICTNKFAAFCSSPSLWKELKCLHRMCLSCYKNIEISRETMSGMPCTSVTCPFCKAITGIAVGDCPDGLMTVNYISSSCDGYGSYNSMEINYKVDSGRHQLNRFAYLPNSPEGKEVLELLIMGWDRKLLFTIGTSITTGQENVLVWNIHQKSSQTGGVQRHGYPDDGYFTRVRAELSAYGIE